MKKIKRDGVIIQAIFVGDGGGNMDACTYDQWFSYYDPEELEKRKIDVELSKIWKCDVSEVWKNKRVLEIGSGTGRFTLKIIDDVSALYAIEPDFARLQILKKKINENVCWTEKTKLYASTLIDNSNESCLWEKFDIIVFSWSWAFIDEKNQYNEKSKTLDIAMNLLKSTGLIVVTMVVGGEFEETCDELRKNQLLFKELELERNRDAMKRLLKLVNDGGTHSSVCFNGKIVTYFQFPNNYIALQEIKKDIGQEICDDLIIEKIGDSTRLTDELQMVICKKSEHKKITFNYKLCDNQGDCSAMIACENYSVGAIVRKSNDLEQSMQLRVLEHLCVKCKRCISICELFALHNTWAEFFEKNRFIETLERKKEYMDEFRYASGSGDKTRRLKSIEEVLNVFNDKNRVTILEIVDGNNHASSYDCPKIIDLIGKSNFDKIYFKFDIPTTLSKEDFSTIRKILREKMNIQIFPCLVVINDSSIKYKYEGHLSITTDGNNKIEAVKNAIAQAIREVENGKTI